MNIVLNGGTKGIGKEVALYLAGKKANRLLITGRNISDLNYLSSTHDNIIPFQIDISNYKINRERFREFVTSTFKRIDILINMAGALISSKFSEFSEDDARIIMETNFFGPASIIRDIAPLMQKGSHIVNISSMGGFQGSSKFNGLSYYSASKAALASLTECLATEFNESGISVNCLALGSVQTEMLSIAFPGYKAPLKAEEMAEYIGYFALTGQKYFNGKIIPVALNNP